MTYLIQRDERNLVHAETIYTSISSQTVTSSAQVDVNGTEIQYDTTGHTYLARWIVYEYNIQMYWNSTNADAHASFELWEKIGSTWSSLGANYRACERFTFWHNSVLAGKFFIPVFTGVRSYKLRARSENSSHDFRLNVATTGAGLENRIRPPLIKMYTI